MNAIPYIIISALIVTAAYGGYRYGFWIGSQWGTAQGYRKCRKDYRP
jgi:hypothetical protein